MRSSFPGTDGHFYHSHHRKLFRTCVLFHIACYFGHQDAAIERESENEFLWSSRYWRLSGSRVKSSDPSKVCCCFLKRNFRIARAFRHVRACGLLFSFFGSCWLMSSRGSSGNDRMFSSSSPKMASQGPPQIKGSRPSQPLLRVAIRRAGAIQR